MKRNIDHYDYPELNEIKAVLEAVGMPSRLYNARSVLTLAAITEVSSGKWSKISENYKSVHDIIVYINEKYPNKAGFDSSGYKENSRESFRDETIHPWIEAGLVEERSGLATNDRNNAYRLTGHAAALLRRFGSNDWAESLDAYLKAHPKYVDMQKQVKNIDPGYEVDYGGLKFTLGRSPHNKLQQQILDNFARRFAPGAELLYIGDTKDKGLCKNDARMRELGIDVFEKTSKIPDVILYDKKNNRILFVEAYHSTGEFTPDRVNGIKKALKISADTEVAFITAFENTKKMLSVYRNIAWDTDIWVVEDETHMTHKNGDNFIGRKL